MIPTDALKKIYTTYSGCWSDDGQQYHIICRSEAEYIRACHDAGVADKDIQIASTRIEWLHLCAQYMGGKYGAFALQDAYYADSIRLTRPERPTDLTAGLLL